jgi:hypothetical protein
MRRSSDHLSTLPGYLAAGPIIGLNAYLRARTINISVPLARG